VADVDAVNITVFGLAVLVLLYKNWIPAIMGWIQDRARS
jgi:hypothetical protein